jgi:hypothetical protein
MRSQEVGVAIVEKISLLPVIISTLSTRVADSVRIPLTGLTL